MKNIVISLMIFFGLNSFCAQKPQSLSKTDQAVNDDYSTLQKYLYVATYASKAKETILAKKNQLISENQQSPQSPPPSIITNKDMPVCIDSIVIENGNAKKRGKIQNSYNSLYIVRHKETKTPLYSIELQNGFFSVPADDPNSGVEILAVGKESNGQPTILHVYVQYKDIIAKSTLPTTIQPPASEQQIIEAQQGLEKLQVSIDDILLGNQQILEKAIADQKQANQEPSFFIMTNRVIAFASFLALAAIVYNFGKIQAQFFHMMGR